MFGDGRLQGNGVDLEGAWVRLDHLHGAAGPLDEHLVLGEVRGDDEELISRAGQAVEHAAQGRGSPHGDVQVVGGHPGLESLIEVGSQQRPGGGVTLSAGVAVEGGGVLGLEQADSRLVDLGGWGDGGVADGEVEHILPAHLGGALVAVFKQLPDHRAGGAQLLHALGYHGDDLLWKDLDRGTASLQAG